MALLDDYSQTLLSNLQRFRDLGGEGGAEVIKDNCVNCLAHLAALCDVLDEIEAAPRTEPGALCDLTMGRLGELAEHTSMGEYTRLDLLLGVRPTL